LRTHIGLRAAGLDVEALVAGHRFGIDGAFIEQGFLADVV